jgi:iron complex transport system substrate-binding protein
MRRPHTLRLLVAMATAALLVLVARPNAAMPPQRQTAAPAVPQRIISLIPAVTEMLFAIGAGNEVVAVSNYDHFPAEVQSRPRVGALVDPDFERILSLKPDLVIVYGTQDDLIARLGRANLPIFRYEHAGLADITATIRAIGARVGHADDARRVADQIESGLEAVRRRVAGQPRPSTAVIFGREAGSLRGIFASAGVGFLHDMLETAGGTDCFGDIKRQSVQASVETMLARAPEVLLELRPSEGWSAERLAQERDVWKPLSSIPAVRTNRVYILAGDSLLVPGPRVLEAVLRIAAALHPGS